LLEQIERAAAAAGGWPQVDLLAVGLGPGSFTGLRIAIATARGLSTGLGLAVAGISTLDALGRAIGEAGIAGERLAVLDASRKEVFAALYSDRGESIWAPFVCRPEELVERLAQRADPPSAAGSGAVRFRHELAPHGVRIADDADPVHRVAARHICALAAESEAGEAGPLAPIYLRPPDAERWRERDSFQRAE
jgi:tRNA threonylcarbamoyladenosine biosynthesis protein TsaB